MPLFSLFHVCRSKESNYGINDFVYCLTYYGSAKGIGKSKERRTKNQPGLPFQRPKRSFRKEKNFM